MISSRMSQNISFVKRLRNFFLRFLCCCFCDCCDCCDCCGCCGCCGCCWSEPEFDSELAPTVLFAPESKSESESNSELALAVLAVEYSCSELPGKVMSPLDALTLGSE